MYAEGAVIFVQRGGSAGHSVSFISVLAGKKQPQSLQIFKMLPKCSQVLQIYMRSSLYITRSSYLCDTQQSF